MQALLVGIYSVKSDHNFIQRHDYNFDGKLYVPQFPTVSNEVYPSKKQ